MDREVRRKLVHLLSGTVVMVLYLFGRHTAVLLSFSALILILFLELIRIDYRVNLGIEELLRSKEKKAFLGATYFLISAVICLSLFPEDIAAASLLFTTLGDTAAAVVGKHGVHRVFRYKTLEGLLAELLTDLAVGYFIAGAAGIPMAVIATLVEFLSFRTDDNLLVPLISGTLGSALRYMGW